MAIDTRRSRQGQISQIHPIAIEVLREIGVDISGRRSKPLSEFEGREVDPSVILPG